MLYFLSVYQIFIYCQSHPQLIGVLAICDYLYFWSCPFYLGMSSWVILTSCTAMTMILFILMILAIFGHFELWAPSFFPLMFQDASVIPFFFPIFDWKC